MYVWPFVSMLYPVFIYVYYNHYDTYIGSEEWTFVALGSIITLHAMSFLVCQWSVDVKALFTCVKVRSGWESFTVKSEADRGLVVARKMM